MKSIWSLVALGVAAFIVFALVTLPAGVVLPRLPLQGLSFAGISGTIWNGRAQAVRAGVMQVGSLEWHLHPLALLTGRLSADTKITRVDGFAQTKIAASASGRVAFEGLSASVPLSTLPPAALPGGWSGQLNLKLDTLVVENGWPTQAVGKIEGLDLTGPVRRPVEIGSYSVTFPPGSASADSLKGNLTDLGGPLQVTGTVELKKDRSYLVDGLIATRPGAPENVGKTLEYLGAPDAQGRRQFSFSGSF